MTVAFFVADIVGGVRLECQACKGEDDYKSYAPWTCKKCDAKMEYPSGASW